MFDIFDIFAFVVFAVLIAAALVAVVLLGLLPGWVARNRNHPQAAAVTATGWLSLVVPVFWPLALVSAFVKPRSAVAPGAAEDQGPESPADAGAKEQLVRMQARVGALESALRELRAGKGVSP
jgi:hypothetical protein